MKKLLKIFIIFLFLTILNLNAPKNLSADTMVCNTNEVFYDVKPNGDLQIEVIIHDPEPNSTYSLTKLLGNNEILAYSYKVVLSGSNQVSAYFHLPQTLASTLFNNTEVPQLIHSEIRERDSSNNSTHRNCDITLELTPDITTQIANPTYTKPPGACPQGCPDETTCQVIQHGDPNDPADWTCQEGLSSNVSATKPKLCDNDKGISTAIGCIPTDTAPFVNYILARAVSIGGGIAFLIMLFGAFTLITSAGNPENVQKGKDIITSALTGLLFIIFAIFLLKFIGVDILQLPEFEETKITIPKYKRR